MAKKITRYEIRFKDKKEKGVYYVNFPTKAGAIRRRKALKRRIPKVSWTIHKVKRNAWIPRKK